MASSNTDIELPIETEVYHGYRGPKSLAKPLFRPPISIAINRQTGARGRSVGERLAEMLDFTFVPGESIEFAADDKERMASDVPPAGRQWIDNRFAELLPSGSLAEDAELQSVIKAMLEFAAVGNCVLVGKGSTFVLPRESTLRIRLIAPESDRAAYITQWERMPFDAAAIYTRDREQSRGRWLRDKFGINQELPEQYDLILNTSELGVEGCAEIALAALKVKHPDLR